MRRFPTIPEASTSCTTRALLIQQASTFALPLAEKRMRPRLGGRQVGAAKERGPPSLYFESCRSRQSASRVARERLWSMVLDTRLAFRLHMELNIADG